MEFTELSAKNETELRQLLVINREKLREARFKDSNKQLKNVRELRSIKQLIARVLTILNKSK